MGLREIGKWVSLAAKRAEIERLVSQAAKTGASADDEKLFASLPGYELFYNVIIQNESSAESSAQKSSHELIPLVDTPQLNNVMRFFTSNANSSQLQTPYAGMIWQHILEMLLKSPLANGLIVVNSAGAGIGINKPKAKRLFDSLSAT